MLCSFGAFPTFPTQPSTCARVTPKRRRRPQRATELRLIMRSYMYDRSLVLVLNDPIYQPKRTNNFYTLHQQDMFLSFQRLRQINSKSRGAAVPAIGAGANVADADDESNSHCSMVTPVTDASPTNVADLFDIPFDPEPEDDAAVDEENATEENSNVVEDDVVAEPTVPQQITVLQPAAGSNEKKLRCHPHQLKFIKDCRDRIDAGKCPELYVDWTNIAPTKPRYGKGAKKIEAADMYVKPYACWAPHLLLAGGTYRPWCPTCETNEHVDVHRAWWVDHPLVMHSLAPPGMKYLDTFRYPCTKCGKRFRGTNTKSLALDDTNEVLAAFRIYMMPRCAVEEDLYLYVVKRLLDPTAHIAQHLREMVIQKYICDLLEFLASIKLNRIKLVGQSNTIVVASDHHQPALDNFAVQRSEIQAASEETKQIVEDKRQLRRLESKLKPLESKVNDSIDLQRLCDAKKAKKSGTVNIKLGPAKIEGIMGQGFTTAREILSAWDSGDRAKQEKLLSLVSGRPAQKSGVVKSWVEAIRSEFNNRIKKRDDLKAEVDELKAKIRDAEASTPMNHVAHRRLQIEDGSVGEATARQLPTFSTPWSRNGYNARSLSRRLVEDIKNSYFAARMPLMVQRMASLGGTILSIDTQYGTAKRITVYHNGSYFHPFNGYTTIMNEFGEIIWWGMITGSESITELAPRLAGVKERLNKKQGPDSVKVIFVDNCCHVRAKLQAIFGPNVLVLLDHFHWLKRWDPVLRDKKSSEAALFRNLMSRALLLVTRDEYNRKKAQLTEKLKKKNPPRLPSPVEILKASNTTTPRPEELKKRILAVISYTQIADATKLAANQQLEEDDATRAKLTLKDSSILQKTMKDQLKHINCLCYPENMAMHIQAPNGNEHVASQSSKNEALHQNVNRRFLQSSRIGVGTARRGIWSYFDRRNADANVRRRGAEDYETDNIESLALVNSLAKDNGYGLPFPDVSIPSNPLTEEKMGFDLGIGATGNPDYQAEENNNIDAEEEEEGGEEGNADDEEADHRNEAAEEENANDIHQRLTGAVFANEISPSPNTITAFTAMANGQPWIPFNLDKNDAVSKEERDLFNKMAPKYDRNATPSKATTGYNLFRDAWNEEAGKRYTDYMTNRSSKLIMRKTTKQLQDHFDARAAQMSASLLCQASADANRESLRRTMRDTRKVTAAPPRFQVAPARFPIVDPNSIPTGRPTTANSNITMSGVTRRADSSAPFAVPPPASKRARRESSIAGSGTRKPDARRICNTCGRRKQDHNHNAYGTSCDFTTCGKCKSRVYEHMVRGVSMGFECTLSNPKQSEEYYDNIK